ncbi:LADA_0B01882g1_1 [Lachancea dasiensis]|uniref:LADA_0B01882g1_1 n=1 Tax=Lachancea dasiensis TaxID=1072105 RepID=A0A1G4ISK5_9SACH|nr:LADA_0B01882g1_1 [Lachancea dasiensis]
MPIPFNEFNILNLKSTDGIPSKTVRCVMPSSSVGNANGESGKRSLVAAYSMPNDVKQELEEAPQREDPLRDRVSSKSVYAKETSYQRKRFSLELKEEGDNTLKRPLDEPAEATREVHKKSRWDITEPTASLQRDSVNSSLTSAPQRSRWDADKPYQIPEVNKTSVEQLSKELITELPGVKDLQFFKPSDKSHFGELLNQKEELTEDEEKDHQFLRLLLRIKNGKPQMRKVAMRALRDRAAVFGAPRIFNRVLPILMDRSLEDQERHLMIKVVDRILNRLQDLVKPYTHRILVVIAPTLIDEDDLTRDIGREIISQLAHAVGLATIITAVRKDIDHQDEYVRNITSRVMAVVAKALGVSHMFAFLNAVCHSHKSWRARHTGVKTIQGIARILGIGVLPYLQSLMECICDGLNDEQLVVRITTAQCIASLAQSTYPYGIEIFNPVLEPLWKGIRTHRGKALASFLRALGFLIPLMDKEYAGYYTQEVMRVVKREFQSPDDEMKKAVLLVLQKCCAADGLVQKQVREDIMPDFFRYFWSRRTALDRQINKSVVYTTLVLSEKGGGGFTVENLLNPLRDESEPLRVMAVRAVSRIIKHIGSQDIDRNLERRLVDALLIAFQEQVSDDRVVVAGFGAVIESLDVRMHPYLSPIVSTILQRLKHKSPTIRQHAADLCASLIPAISNCGEQAMLNKINIILYEQLGEVFPEVLGSIIGAMSQAVARVDFTVLQPPANQILPNLTPILRNRHRKVQQNSIVLIGRIADKGPESVPPKEWMRICFELLEMLKSPNKLIRRAANNSFGSIANTIGPQDVLVALLNNLKVQERQLRVCTAVAIGIVAERCGPVTVLPAIMNEYKTPDTNVQNGVLKAMTFMFEYIGPISKDFIYATLPLLQDAFTDRDLVHRQTAASVSKHLALNCMGKGYEDAFLHLLNLLMPNIFETSPHVIVRVLEGVEALGIALGVGILSNYIWAGLFHPAKKVRKAFWTLYNNAYIQGPDSLVAYYPRTEMNPTFEIEEMELVL